MTKIAKAVIASVLGCLALSSQTDVAVAETATNAFTRNAFTRNAFTRNAFTRNAFTRNAFTRNAFTRNAFTRNGVAAGSPLLVIGDSAALWVRVYVPEGQVNRVTLGQPAEVRFDGIERAFKGHVSFVAPKAEFTPRNVQTAEERVTQAFAVKVLLDERDARLRPGVAADVLLRL